MKNVLTCKICGYVKPRDVKRQEEIEKFLNCKFIRIKYEQYCTHE